MACEVRAGFCALIFVLSATFSRVSATKCLYKNPCPGTQHCCLRNKVCRSNCIDEPCWDSSQCAPGEYCCDGKCTLNCSSCSYDTHCLSGETCCGPSSVGENLNSTCEKYCSGKLCVDNSDCPGSLHNCCAGVCQIGCSYCHNDTECSSGEVCCSLHLYNKGHCAKSCVNSCKSYHHCPPGQYCCGAGKVGKCATSCVGKSCKYDYRCASGESCCSDGKCAASCVGKTCHYTSNCGTGEYCCDRAKGTGKCATSCVGKSCKYQSHCATHEYCCGNTRYIRKCAKSCIGRLCEDNSECASGEHCSGRYYMSYYYKVCSRTQTAQACYTNVDCSTGQCCGDDRNCRTWPCDSKKKDGSGLFIAIFISIPFAIILVCLCLSICVKKRKDPRESTESIAQAHENILLSIGRNLEHPEENEQQSQQQQLQSLDIENLRPYTNPPPPLYLDQPPPLYLDQPQDEPTPPNEPPPAYSTLSSGSFQPRTRISPPPYQSGPPLPS